MKSKEGENQNLRQKISLITLADCYILATFVYIFITGLFSGKHQPNNIPTGTKAMLGALTAPTALFEVAILLSIIALPLFGVWLLLRKFIFKKPYTEQAFRKIRNISIIFCILLLLILIIQAAQY